MKNKKGFTLVEVLVTITILGIVTLISLPVISAISSKLNNNKLNTYKGIIESGAKIYTDSHDIDLFGYQKNGCVDIYYSTLVNNKIIDELDFSNNNNVVVDKIFVRVKKINDNYDYEIFIPTEEEIASLDFNFCNGSISDNGPAITFSPDGNTKFEKSSYTNIQIKDILGISPNAKIKYQWFYENGTPIGTAKNHDFKNSVTESLSLRVDTPTGLNGQIKLVVTPVDLNSEAGLSTTAASQSKLFKLDNTAPVINIDAYQESGGNKTGGVLKSANNSNLAINTWAKYGYYFDFSRSTDNSGITKETWSWNKAGKVTLDTALTGGSGTYTSITNHTFTGTGYRYGSLTLCDQANNCNTKTIQVAISPKYYISYNANGGNGSIGSTTCYYGYDCTLSNNSYSRNGYYFTKWNINGTDYNAGSNVKNLSSTDGQTLTAKAGWHGNSYTIVYNANGGGGSTGNTTCTYGSDCRLAGNGFSRGDHDFTGWSINGTNYSAGSNVKSLATSGTVTAYAQWKRVYYTVYYNVYGGTWYTKKTRVGDNIDTGPNPQGYVGEFKQFNGWNDNPGRMPERDVTLNANISDQMCRVCTGHAGEYRVSAFVGVFDAAGWTGSRMEDFWWEGAWYKRVVTDFNMTRWQAEDALNYVWNHTSPTGAHALNYIELNCANGYGYYRRRPWY